MKETVIDVVNAMLDDADHQAAWTDGEIRDYAHRVAQAYRREATKWRVAAFRSRQMAASRVTKNGPDVTNFQKRRERKGNTPLNPLKEKRDQEKLDISSRTRDGEIEFEFGVWWANYPRKVGKRAARIRYRQLAKEQSDPKAWAARLLKALKLHRETQQWRDIRFIPHPLTWLNQGRWEDVLNDDRQPINNADSALDALPPELKQLNERLNNL